MDAISVVMPAIQGDQPRPYFQSIALCHLLNQCVQSFFMPTTTGYGVDSTCIESSDQVMDAPIHLTFPLIGLQIYGR